MRKSAHTHARKLKRAPLLRPLVRALKEAFSRIPHRRPPKHPRPTRQAAAKPIRFEALEPRVLLSGDVNPAQTVAGSIDVPGETDQYGFTLQQDARIVFDSVTNNPSLNWTLTGPAGTQVDKRAFSASDATTANPMLELPAGEYTLTVDADGDVTGGYSFRLIDLFRATELVPGTVVASQLSPANETDVYRLSATAGERFYFDFKSLTGTNVTWRLFEPSGRQAFGPDSISTEREYTATADGSYALVIEGAIGNTGTASYSFNAQKIADDVKPLVLGESQGTEPRWTAGQLGGGLLLDGLQYGEVAHNASIDLTRTVTMEAWIKFDRFADTNAWTPLFYKSNGTSNQTTYGLWLHSSGFLQLDSSDGSYQAIATANGTIGTGQWYHVAGVIDRNTGVMKIYIDGVERASGAVRTTSAVSNTNSLLIGRSLEYYVNLEGTIDEVRLWNVARTASEIAAGRDAELAGNEAGLAAYLKANEQSGDRLVDSSGHGNDAPIRSFHGDKVVAGRIDHPGQRDLYTFDVADAKQVYFDSLTNNGSLTWSLIGPRGTLISNRPFSASDSSDFGPGSPIIDLAAGSYTLIVDASADNTYSYAFRLLDLAQAPVIAPGTVISGQLGPARETDLYRFAANAGERFYFDFLDASTFTGGEIFWRLVDPYGKVVFGPTVFTADMGLKTLELSGTYMLLIEGRVKSPQTSTYSFNAQLIADDSTPLVLGESSGTGPHWTSGQLGGGVNFDGLQYGEIAHNASIDLNRVVTLEAWIKLDRFADQWTPLLFKGSSNTQEARSATPWAWAIKATALSAACTRGKA